MGLCEGEGEARQARGDSHIFADVLYQMPKQLLRVKFVYYVLSKTRIVCRNSIHVCATLWPFLKEEEEGVGATSEGGGRGRVWIGRK